MEECKDDIELDIDEETVMDACDNVQEEICDVMPTREEYDSLMSGIFKEFYESDIKKAKDEAKIMINEEREQLIREAQRELLSKIRAKNQRISEVGATKGHGNAKRRVSDMTKEERALVAKRAARGEIINLK